MRQRESTFPGLKFMQQTCWQFGLFESNWTRRALVEAF